MPMRPLQEDFGGRRCQVEPGICGYAREEDNVRLELEKDIFDWYMQQVGSQ